MPDNLISESYLEEQRFLHFQHPRRLKYGTGGATWAALIGQIARQNECKTILDYGCGKGVLKTLLPGIDVQCYDPAVPEFDTLPAPADLVVCLDVLEHVEPNLIGNVLDHIASLTEKLLFVAISQKPTARQLRDGRNAHLIVKTTIWWEEQFWAHGCEIIETFPTTKTEFVALARMQCLRK